MRVVLVNPGSNLHRTGGLLARFVTPIPPLGLAALAAWLGAHGHEAVILDQYAERWDTGELVRRMLRERPDLVGFSCLTPNMGRVRETVAAWRRAAPGVPVVLGNTHATVFADRLLREGVADHVVRGEGEEPLLGLVRALDADRAPEDVANLSWRDEDGGVHHNPDARPTVPLDALPFADWSTLDLSRYRSFPVVAMHDTVIPIQGSRGCAYHCSFCAQDQVFQAVRRRSIDRICDEIEHHIDRYGVTHYGFNDAYFPLSIRQGHAFLDELERRGLHRRITWITETRVDKVDRDLLRRMGEDGCRLVLFGIEFGTDAVLEATGKHARTAQARDAVRWAREAGVLTLGLYVIGMPGETRESVLATLRFARELSTDIAKFNIAVPLPGSQFFEEVFGPDAASRDLDTDAFHSWYNPLVAGDDLAWTPEGMSGTELVWLQRLGMLGYYARPRFVLQTLRSGAIRPADMARGTAWLLGDLGAMAASALRGRLSRANPGR